LVSIAEVQKAELQKEQDDSEFIKKTYLKQQTKLNLKIKYIPDEIIAKESDSFGESFNYSSSDPEDGVIKLNTTPNPASMRRGNQMFSNATSSQLTDNLNFNYLDDSQ
jgi:hypothetical protein